MSDNESADQSTGKGLSRRRMIQAAGAGAGALALGAFGRTPGAMAATTGTAASAASAAARQRTGTIKDLKHIVVVMQENRSYDAYFGTLAVPGSAGFADKQAIAFRNGHNILFQPNASYPEGYQLPYRLDTTRYNGQFATPTYGYYERADIPWQHALASAYTVGDHYYCSLFTSTDPNRIMMWTGTNDPQGGHGGPRINNNQNGQFLFTWETYPEVLQRAGVSWQVYVNNDWDGDKFLGDFEDNLLRDFAAYNPANANAQNTVPGQGLLARANVLTNHTTPPAGVTSDPTSLDYVLKDFIADCASGRLPEISYVVSPAWWSEHPGGTPNWGAVYTNRVIQALHSNPELWDSTLVILNYDEDNGGSMYDHVLRPVPEANTPGEGALGINPGTGPRVPLVLISPWTRGGWVAKETFDHTSLIQLMEKFTTSLGKPALCSNISDWRRSICGDLTSAIDFSSFDNSLPALPDPAGLLAAVTADQALPGVPAPVAGQQVVPVQQVQGALKLRPAPYQQHATVAVDRSAGTVTAAMTNDSVKAASMQVYEGSVMATPFGFKTNTAVVSTPNTVSRVTGAKTYAANVAGGKYDFAIYGPDHFVRSFAGTVIPAGKSDGQVPIVDAKPQTGDNANRNLKITLTNEGNTPVVYTLTPNDYAGVEQTVTVDGQHVNIFWPTNQYGYYDVIITANTTDGFTYRYAGRIR